ncbi:hypothetical protein EV426DRAFT_614644 [Tirmania nivea]|nr:hypothetical protein EV426DRAFT_614644 [Tirmania nivea]
MPKNKPVYAPTSKINIRRQPLSQQATGELVFIISIYNKREQNRATSERKRNQTVASMSACASTPTTCTSMSPPPSNNIGATLSYLESIIKARVRSFLSSLFRDNSYHYRHSLASLQSSLEAHLRNHFTSIGSDYQWEQILGWHPLHTAESARDIGLQVPKFQLPPASWFGQSASFVEGTDLRRSWTWAAVEVPRLRRVYDLALPSTGSVEHAPSASTPTTPPTPLWSIPPIQSQGPGFWEILLGFNWGPPSVPDTPTPPSKGSSVSPPPAPLALAEEASVLLDVFCQSLNEDAASAGLIKGALNNVNKVWDTLWKRQAKGIGHEDRVQSQWVDQDPNLMVYLGCVICYSKVAETVLLPCNHLILCVECCDDIGIKDQTLVSRNWAGTEKGSVKCPLCRAVVTHRIKIFRG